MITGIGNIIRTTPIDANGNFNILLTDVSQTLKFNGVGHVKENVISINEVNYPGGGPFGGAYEFGPVKTKVYSSMSFTWNTDHYNCNDIPSVQLVLCAGSTSGNNITNKTCWDVSGALVLFSVDDHTSYDVLKRESPIDTKGNFTVTLTSPGGNQTVSLNAKMINDTDFSATVFPYTPPV